MLRFSALAGASLAIVLLSGCAGSGALGTPPLAQTAGKTVKYARPLRAPLGLHSIVPNLSGKAPRALCPRTTVSRHASCFAAVRMDASTVGAFPDSVNGLTPNDLSILYNYPAPNAQAGTGPVVAIVIAYDAPNAEADLATYRSYFGLPPCSSASGCFTKVGVSAPSVNGTAATADASSRRSSASSRARPDSVSPFPERPNDPEQPDSISPDPGRPTVPGSPGKRSSSDDALANPDSISPFPETSAGGWPDEADVDLETLSAVSFCRRLPQTTSSILVRPFRQRSRAARRSSMRASEPPKTQASCFSNHSTSRGASSSSPPQAIPAPEPSSRRQRRVP